MANQRTKIYVEGVELDLDKNVDIDFTYSISDIADFEKRTTTFSKTVSIPGTAHNNFIFGNYFDFNINNDFNLSLDNSGVNFNPLKKAFVKVTIDEVEVFAGVLRLLEITSIDGVLTYQCALFGSLNNLFGTIGDKLLTDLDLSDINQIYTLANIQDSWTRTDYIYALGNYGVFRDDTESKIDVSNFRPALFAKEIFNRIFDEAGYTYNTDFWDENNLDKIAVLNNEELFGVYVSELGGAFIESQIVGISYAPLQLDPGNLFDNYIDFVLDGLGDYNIVNNSPNAIKVTIRGQLGWSRAVATADVLSFAISSSVSDYPITGTSGLTEFEVTFVMEAGLTYKLTAKINSTPINVSALTSNFYVYNFDPLAKIPAIYGKTIEGKSFVPTGIKQADFVKSIINAFNLYIIQDKDNEFNLSLTPYPDFYLDESVDWTNKKDLAKGFSIKSSNDFLPKTMSFKYKPDNDYYSKLYNNTYNQAYGTKVYTTQNEFSKDDKSFELIFSLVPNLYINTNMALPAMFDINENGTYKKVKMNPKLAFFGGMKSCSNYEIHNGTTLLDATNTDYPYFGHLYDYEADSTGDLWDLCFEAPKEIYLPIDFYPNANLFSKYYSQFTISQDNKDAKLVMLYFLLNSIDIMDLDFKKYVMVDNGLYYLNKVDGYNPLGNELTKVELLRIV